MASFENFDQENDGLRDGQSLFISLVNSIPACFIRKDRDGTIVFVNDNFAKLFGKQPEEIVGKSIADFYPQEFADDARDEDVDVMRTGRVLEDVFEDDAGGSTIHYASRKGPVRNDQGEVIGIQTIFWDITEQRKAELALIAEREELRAAKLAADAANRAKSDFVANMSHEIRTPMNAIIGITDLLLSSETTNTQREYLKMVQDSGEALLTLINDILDFSKIESGKFELQMSTFDIREMLGDTMKGLGFRAHSKDIELAFRVDQSIPSGLIGDPSRIRQIVVNLVGNAIKFTDRGEVLLELKCTGMTDSEIQLLIRVVDTGIGISEENCEKVFHEFEQADSSTTRRFGGTGLGLAISSRLVEMMKGRIWVESEVGKGSTFQIELPLSFDTTAVIEHSDSKVDVRGIRVLVVDDNATNRRILKDMLTKWGMNPVTTSGAASALTAITDANEEDDSFRLVISDVNMPDMDGLDLAKAIVEMALLNPANIIMLTSGARPEDDSQLRALGISLHLLKPAKQSELYDAVVSSLNSVTTTQESDVSHAEGDGSSTLRQLNILLAEDNAVNQKLAVGILQKLGHQVTIANNGREALQLLSENMFDLVLMDVQMPEMDGLEATKELRKREANSDSQTTVVAMTAHAMKGDRENCLSAGMDDYLCKPIRIKDMETKLLELFESSRSAEVSIDTEEPNPSEINWAEALANVGGDDGLLRELVMLFLDDTPKLMSVAVQAAEQGDTNKISSAIHSVRGSMLFLNPKTAMKLADKIELHSGQGDLEESRVLMADLQIQFAIVCASLNHYLSRVGGTNI